MDQVVLNHEFFRWAYNFSRLTYIDKNDLKLLIFLFAIFVEKKTRGFNTLYTKTLFIHQPICLKLFMITPKRVDYILS